MESTDDRGAALVEAALILPVLILLFAGMVEYGLAWRASNSVVDRVGAASLALSRNFGDRHADLRVLEQIRSADDDLDDIVWVIVYRTNDPAGELPAACLSAAALSESLGPSGVEGVCNAYPGSAVADLGPDDFGGPDCTGDPDVSFCPSTRQAALQPGDRLGVAIRVKHSWLTGMLPGSGPTITDHAVGVPIN